MRNDGEGPNSGKFMKYAMYAAGAMLVFNIMSRGGGEAESDGRGGQLDYRAFDQKVMSGEIRSIVEKGDNVIGLTKDGRRVIAGIPRGVVPYNDFYKSVDTYSRAEPETDGVFLRVLLSFGPVLLMMGLMVFMLRGMSGGAGGALGQFRQSKAKREIPETKFDDVVGIDAVREDAVQFVKFLKNPQKFGKLGARVPKGIIMEGPPGTGKTLIARAIAGEANVPFFSVSGSDFVEMFVGVGAARVRDLFEQAKNEAPSIIFIDEIDAIGKKRGADVRGGNDEREQTLNAILTEMDGFTKDTGVIVIAATNRVDVLDPALIRPGRFDRKLHVGLPDMAGRQKILELYSRKVPLAPDVDLRQVAMGTPQFSGAELENLVNEAAMRATIAERSSVTFEDFDKAKDKIMMGEEHRTYTMTPEQRKMTAYHEAGHAWVAMNESASDPVYKATILPRGGALGYVIRLPEGDNVSFSRARLHADLAVAMGGRVAEEEFFGYDAVTTGASGDFDTATSYATRMVTEWGMSDKLGPRRYTDQEQSFSGKFTSVSDDTRKVIDAEIRAILDKAYNRAKTIQLEGKVQMHRIAEALLKFDTLTGPELRAAADGQDIDEMRRQAEAARVRANPQPSAPGDDDQGGKSGGDDVEADTGNMPVIDPPALPPRKPGASPWNPS